MSIYLSTIRKEIEKMRGKVVASKIQNKGKDLRIHGDLQILGQDGLKIGDYVRIGKNCFFSCSGGVEIGDNVQFSRNIIIYSNSHRINSSAIPYDRQYDYKPVKIGNSVWIGMNVTIAPGTIIGDGAIIGMGTTVSGKIPKGAIVVGAKHRIVGYRDIKTFDKMKDEKKYFGILYPDN